MLAESVGFRFQAGKIIQNGVTDVGKRHMTIAEKRIKISRSSRQTDDNKVCLL